jgi:hypothetical protein
MHSVSPIDLGADSKLLISLYGRIAQLVRALASHARGRRFESYCDHQLNLTLLPQPDLFLGAILGSLNLSRPAF